MSRRSSTAAALTVAALAFTATLPPLAAGQDLRSPDARDAAARAAGAGVRGDTNPAAVTYEDLRSPDARDVTRPTVTPADLRSPDARDVTRPRTVVPVRIVTVAEDGFDWTDAAIGAGGAFGLALLLGGGASTISRRRTARRVAA